MKIKFGVPDVNFGMVEVDTADMVGSDAVQEAIDEAVGAASALREAYLEAFAPPAPPARQGADLDQRIFSPPQNAPQRPSQPRTGAQGGDGNRVFGEEFGCPQCGSKVIMSKPQYQQWEFGPDGREYAQKWFCGNDACETKSLWRSKLTPLEATPF